MKALRIALLFLFAACFAPAARAQDSTGAAKVYFVRNTGYNGMAIAFHCFIDSVRVCDLRNKHYSVHTVPAGDHTLNVTLYAKEIKTQKNTLTLSVEKDKIYYIKILPGKTYNYGGTFQLLSVAETTIKSVLADCKEQTDCLK
ncbi:DUF2846 domain-containing protein [Chitinophaga barathri]|uniref:DUF2846 domain-containing protein n=1 Tax=Chitinophaga barathri TaxID=1647451 RepID=A0A3N4MVU5_9BACT|nr:DUF2846 domain-containing protein [Chitinophaga barathri]RPD39513.1 DUF2846 domain-containing protein [Chitinophaga barathri]